MHKKHRMAAACLAVFTLTAMLSGCTDISGSDAGQTPIEMEASGAADTSPAAETDAAAVENDDTAEESTAQEEDAVSSEDSAASPDNDEQSDDGVLIGDTGLTAEEWCEQAQQIYTTAAAVYYTYLCSSDGFTYDASDVIDENWQRVTSCDTLEEATAEYYSVFAQTGHENDLNEQFRVVDDKLYRLCGDRGADISYLDSEVTALTDSTDDTLTFTVVSTYQFPDETEQTTQEDIFTLVLERGVWRVGQFTMPY
ncbi:MAG: hypothetical protein ACI4XB_02335 [Ruminococcus sp.]